VDLRLDDSDGGLRKSEDLAFFQTHIIFRIVGACSIDVKHCLRPPYLKGHS
jgi:hypothetical protein